MKTAIQRLLPVALLAIGLHLPATARTGNDIPDHTKTPAQQHSMQQGVPFAFIENKGQITDQHNRERKDIDYKLSVPGMDIYLGAGELHYQWSKEERSAPGGERGTRRQRR
ncbi:MAG: hypothetical protein EOP56_18335 [Sphingobacteriales bacterium]|nr:MAG: hypothetical protein EOP56_18335 [Sphingobacteriales bacterium]